MSKITYTECPASEVPAAARWDVPAYCQGQIVEVAYSTGRSEGAHLADRGDAYKRVTDTSCAVGHPSRVSYYRAMTTDPAGQRQLAPRTEQ